MTHLHLFAARLPILFADFVILLVLTRWLKNKQKKVLWYYWCSPILFYINYVHGQLDAIPIMLLFVFLYFFFKESFRRAFLFLGLSLATKTGIAIVLPFVFVYLILRRTTFLKITQYALISFLTFCFLNIAYLRSYPFLEMVFLNREQAKIFDLHFAFSNGLIVYVIPLVYLFLLIKSFLYKRLNRDIFIMFLGFSFGLLTLLIPPMQGWYYWIIPFFIYFYVKQDRSPRFIFVLLNVFYFLYFLVIKQSDVWNVWQIVMPKWSEYPNVFAFAHLHGLNAPMIVNTVFTLLLGILFVNILWIYRKGIESFMQNKMYYQPYLIAIAGDSGSGKSLLSNLLEQKFGRDNTLVVAGDDMHCWDRGNPNWQNFTPLDPRANKLHDELEHIIDLKAGRRVQRRFYDHSTGKFTSPTVLESKRIILFQGLHALYLNRMRELYDLKIFIEPSEDLRLHWKIKRDMIERGYTKEKVMSQMEKRAQDSIQYIQQQRKHAHVVIRFRPNVPIVDLGGSDESFQLILRLEFENTVRVTPLLLLLEKNAKFRFQHVYEEDKQVLECQGNISQEAIDLIGYELIPELWDLMKGEPHWEKGYNGFIQLFLGYYIFTKMKMEQRYEG